MISVSTDWFSGSCGSVQLPQHCGKLILIIVLIGKADANQAWNGA